MADKPSHVFFLSLGQVFVLFPECFDIFLQLCPFWMRFYLDYSAIGTVEVRVSSVCHGPVEEVVHGVDVHVQILSRFHNVMNISLAGASLGWNIVEIQRSLMEEHCIELLHWHQASIICSEASCFLTEIVIEWFPTKSEIIFLATVSFIPKENILQL